MYEHAYASAAGGKLVWLNLMLIIYQAPSYYKKQTIFFYKDSKVYIANKLSIMRIKIFVVFYVAMLYNKIRFVYPNKFSMKGIGDYG